MTDPARLLPVLQVADWLRIPNLAHGFFTRRGGVSVAPYNELNVSFKVGDSSTAVEENWGRVRAHVGDRLTLVTMTQVHGATVAEIGPSAAHPGDADAMITAAPGVGLCVLTADCVPILLVAPQPGVVAAVHAGWRGTLAGVVVEALRRMNVRASEVFAAIGPAIGQCCYEVDASIADDLEARWASMPAAVHRYERDGEAKAKIDLRAINERLLIEAGLQGATISRVGGCTSCEAAEFYSYRAAARSHPGSTGRQLSFIGWIDGVSV